MVSGTRFTELVGCELPLQLAAMGGVGTIELAAAVSDAGGLGMVRDRAYRPPSGVCGTSFLMPFLPDLERVGEAAGGSAIVEFFYGDPRTELVEAVHAGGALAGWQIGSVEEAQAAVECGCDYVVAQGVEAGGHVRGTLPLDEILTAVLGAVEVPVVAAGGVATAERFAEVMRLGADAVRVGTRFLASEESGAHPGYVSSLIAATGDDATALTEWFGEGWENAPHRVLSSALDAAQESGWRKVQPPDREVERDVQDMAMYAGTGVVDVTKVEPATAIVADLLRLL
jgi:nitronate monooxygenase